MTPVDAAVPVDGNAFDAFVEVDAAQQDDAGDVDGGDPCAACTGDHACLRGVCIPTCGADLAALDASLADELVPVAHVCRTPSAVGFGSGRVYEVSSSIVGGAVMFTLSRWTPGTEAPVVEELAHAMYESAGSEMVFTGGYVAVSPDEAHVVFGYTTNLPGSIGGVFDATTASMTLIENAAPGNFDATFLDATHYLVNGLGFDAAAPAQGLYLGAVDETGGTQVVDHFGQYSGGVAVWGDEDLVLAGAGTFSENWADDMTGDRVLVFGVDTLTGAEPVDGSTVQQIVMPSSFEVIAGPRLASVHYDSTFAQDAIEVRALSREASGEVVVGAPTNLTTGATFMGAIGAGTDTILAHGSGLLFVH